MTIRVRNRRGEEVDAITFLVRENAVRYGYWTSADYVRHIVPGLRAHDVPEDYVQHVIDVAIETNKNAKYKEDAEEQSRLIAALRKNPFTPLGSP